MIFETVTICYDGITVELNRAALASGLQFPRIIRWKRVTGENLFETLTYGTRELFHFLFIPDHLALVPLLVNLILQGHASRFITIFLKKFI